MYLESHIAAVTWLPREALRGPLQLPFKWGVARCDEQPPTHLPSVLDWVRADRCRFCNRLGAFIKVDAGRVTQHGWLGDGLVGGTTLRLGGAALQFAAVLMPTLRTTEALSPTSIRFLQTCGARSALPIPRLQTRPPYFRYVAPTVWTTLELTLHADGHSTGSLAAASLFPRHAVYDQRGRLVQEGGGGGLDAWNSDDVGEQTPWVA